MSKKPKSFEKTIIFLAQTLGDFQYAIRGTAGLVLQGLEMNVDDIDLLCDRETAEVCNDLLAEYVLEEVAYQESPKFKSYFGKLKINGILVEVMGKWQIKDPKGNWSQPFNAAEKERTEIELKGQKVWVTNLETELAMFAKMGRWTALQKIKKQLKSEMEPKVKNQQQGLF